MTVAPASTRANRINSDSLDWSYIGISITFWNSTSVRDGGPRLIHRRPRKAAARRVGLGPATGLLKTKARVAWKHGSRIAVANAADKIRPDTRAGKKDLIH